MSLEKKVVLFGRTGEGKSTIANVLVTGGIERVVFKSSDGAKGCTSRIQKEKGRGWNVTDTVGLGEADVGTTSNAEATSMLTDFLKDVKDTYSHIIYVQKAKRITTVDEITWLLFAAIFKGAEDAFVVIITGATEEWLEENREQLPEYLRQQKILAVNIPPSSKRPVTERNRIAIRKRSITKLEAELIEHFRLRGNQPSIPEINGMTEAQLEEKSWSLLTYIVTQIKRLFAETSWRSVAAKLATLVNVVGFMFTIIGAVTLSGSI